MLHRSIATAIAIVTAAMLLPSDSVVARSGGGGGGHAGGFGSSHPAVPQFGARRFFPSARAGLNIHNRHVAGLRLAHRRFFQMALPGGGWSYGTYDDTFGLTDAYGVETTSPSVEPDFLPPAIYRPACRLQREIRAVPSESGGMRNIAITRCIRPDVSSLARPAGSDSGPYAAEGNRPDQDAFDITSATTVAAGLRAPDVAHVGGCRSERQSVPSESGGRHEVTITRC
jgi:hypothetical protein